MLSRLLQSAVLSALLRLLSARMSAALRRQSARMLAALRRRSAAIRRSAAVLRSAQIAQRRRSAARRRQSARMLAARRRLSARRSAVASARSNLLSLQKSKFKPLRDSTRSTSLSGFFCDAGDFAVVSFVSFVSRVSCYFGTRETRETIGTGERSGIRVGCRCHALSLSSALQCRAVKCCPRLPTIPILPTLPISTHRLRKNLAQSASHLSLQKVTRGGRARS